VFLPALASFCIRKQTKTFNLRQYISTFCTLYMKILLILLPCVMLFTSSFALAQAPAAKGDPVAGQGKAVAICSGCHGMPGTRTAYPEVYQVPRIGGQSAAYLVSALKSYRAGNRYHQTMVGLATALSEKEILDIAAYYADPAFGKAK
jgi:cytochrome c553